MHTRTVGFPPRASRSAFLLALLLAAGTTTPAAPSRAQALWHLSIPPDSLLHWQPPNPAAPRGHWGRFAAPASRPPVAERRASAGPSGADSANWFELGAPVRAGHALVRDTRRNRFLLAGGDLNGDGAHGLSPQHSIWSFDPAAHAWQWLGRAPGPVGHGMATLGAAYDSLRDRLIVITARSGVASVDALSLGGAPSWSHVWTAPFAAPGVLAALLDRSRDQLVLLVPGGSGALLVRIPLDDPPGWSSLPVAGDGFGTPGARSAVHDAPRDDFYFALGSLVARLHAASPVALEALVTPDPNYLPRQVALDDERDRLLLVDESRVAWAIPLAGGDPLRLDDLAQWGSRRAQGQAVAFDPVGRRLYASGGFRYVAKQPLLESVSADSGVTWTFGTPHTGGAPWRTERPDGLDTRFLHQSLVDGAADRLIVIGGSSYGGYRHHAMVRPLSGGEWEPLGVGSVVSPRAPLGSGVAIDDVRHALFQLGGQLTDGSGQLVDEVWRLPLEPGGTWEQLLPVGSGPGPRRFAGSFADPARNRLVVMGGNDLHVAYRDAWELTLGPVPAWRSLELGGGVSTYGVVFQDPVRDEFWQVSGRLATRLAVGPDSIGTAESFEMFPEPTGSGWADTYDFVGFDFSRRRLLLVDAITWEGISTFERAWWVSMDPGHLWTEAPISMPGPHRRAFFGVNFDPTRQRLYVTGGYDDDVTYYADTWYLQMPNDLPTPVAASVRFAESDARGVRLSWAVSGAAGGRASVQRSPDGVAWSIVGEGAWLGDEAVSWDGPPLAARERAAFRLALSSPSGETRTPAVWVSGPDEGGMALAPLPGPPGAELAVALTLRPGAPARLRVLDAAGRKVAEARPPASARAWSFGRAPAPGLYFAELLQGGERRVAKLVSIR